MSSEPSTLDQIPTPALLVDLPALDHNIATMAEARPGPALRPHVKAFKCTALAARLAGAGHRHFCAATPRELIGLATAGLGDDLLLANQTVDPARLAALAALGHDGARITVAVDSAATVAAAAGAGIAEALIDVDVGMPRCGCAPGEAGALADRARAAGLSVRGVMGYEGHVVGNPDRGWRIEHTARAMELLDRAHRDVGGDVVSAGGTGTYDINDVATEIQAGSYVLMDTAYDELGLPFRTGLHLWMTVVSVSKGWAVADGGLKALGLDHGNPTMADGGEVFYCADEHLVFVPPPERPVAVGDRVRAVPAHIDPTIARHEHLWVVDGDRVVDRWAVDLRHW